MNLRKVFFSEFNIFLPFTLKLIKDGSAKHVFNECMYGNIVCLSCYPCRPGKKGQNYNFIQGGGGEGVSKLQPPLYKMEV